MYFLSSNPLFLPLNRTFFFTYYDLLLFIFIIARDSVEEHNNEIKRG